MSANRRASHHPPHPFAYEQAEKALMSANHHHPTDVARCAVDAAAPVLYASWDVDALLAEIERLRQGDFR